jgi:hypothetical protein
LRLSSRLGSFRRFLLLLLKGLVGLASFLLLL